jgi:hypothetical protein
MSPPPAVQNVEISSTNVGEISIIHPTFLERWGTVFVAFAGGWILVVGSGILIYYLCNQPALPNLAGLTANRQRMP